jgi:hypothetical protein
VIPLVVALVLAHPQGFHKRVTLELWSTSITGLVVMDVDGGERCELLRAGADLNRDGLLDPSETKALKKKLTTLATRALKLWISGYPVAVEVKDAKVTLKEDSRVSQTGVSVAVLLEMRHPYAVTPGMSLWLEDSAPDGSHVEIEVFQHGLADAGTLAPVKRSAGSAERVTVRLGALASP